MERADLKQSICLGICLVAFFSGCVANNVLGDAEAADNNVNRLSRVVLRMPQEEVLQIMHAPYHKETFRVGEDRYDVWFYVTMVTVLGQSRMVPKNLTPLTFRNQQLVGVGYDYYHWLQKIEKGEAPKAASKENVENNDLERELRKALVPGGSTAPAQSQAPDKSQTQPPKQPTSPPNPPPKSPDKPKTPANNPAPKQPTNPPNQSPKSPPNQPTNLKLEPPPSKPQTSGHVSMSKPPEKTAPPPPEQPSEKPKWNEKDEEINEDAMDQDFNFW